MRVTVVSSEFPPGPGGIGTNAYHIADQLSRLGRDVLVVTAQDYVQSTEADAFNARQLFQTYRFERRGTWPSTGLARLTLLRRIILEWRPDVVLATGRQSLWLTGILARSAQQLWIGIAHGSEFGAGLHFERLLTRWAFEQASCVVCVSHFTHQQLLMAGIRPRKVRVIPNGADPERFFPLAAESIATIGAAHGIAPEDRVLVTVGNVTERKGQDVVIRALSLIHQIEPKTHYVIIGLPSRRSQFAALAEELGVGGFVHFLGRQESEMLVRWLNRADIFVMTSRYTASGDFEGYGIAAIEAALCGKPAVVSDHSGLPEAIVDGATGLVVPAENPEATARAMLALLRDMDLRLALGKAARQRALAEQTWSERVRAYDSLLTELVTKQVSAGPQSAGVRAGVERR